MILARARSFISAPAFDVISASVSLSVLAFSEHAGPISCKRLAIAAAGSAPFKGEILLPIREKEVLMNPLVVYLD